jgi:hypothetical protein
MPGGVSEHVLWLIIVVSAVVQQGGPGFFVAPPLTLQFTDVGHLLLLLLGTII